MGEREDEMFDHPNVMNLLGVDAGPAPYIAHPFMFGGDLLSHTKGRQESLVLECDARDKNSYTTPATYAF